MNAEAVARLVSGPIVESRNSPHTMIAVPAMGNGL